MATRAVLSISSRVVRGHVGNSAATFALQRLGLEVYEVPTLIWNHHPGHGRPRGIVVAPQDLEALLDRFCVRPWAAEIGTVMSGYLASEGQARIVAEAVGRLRRLVPDLRYVCDPVCGDQGGRYVAEAVVAAFRDQLVPLADVITPNRFELGMLVGEALVDNAGIVHAARRLGCPTTLVTSAFSDEESRIANLLVTREENSLITTERYVRAPHGTGDLMTALLAGRLQSGQQPQEAAALAAASVCDVIELTLRINRDELALIDGQDRLIAPHSQALVRRV